MNKGLSRWIVVLGLIFILSACTGTEVPPVPTSIPAEGEIQTEDQGAAEEENQPSTSANGKELYSNNCLRCHAADRSGNNGPSLLPGRLTEEASHYAEIISSGSGGMPSFGSKLSAEEINSLAAYILTEAE
ncbi:MAG: cytochrome c [Anaerolineales bacterium]